MLSIKLTPFILFLIILIVLVISIILGNRLSWRREGFIAFGGDKNSLDRVSIDQYSTKKPVWKLQDNIFFDTTNGNLIELDATALTGTTYDTTGSTIVNVLITPRQTHVTTVLAAQTGTPVDTELSKTSTVSPSDDYWLYNSRCTTTAKTATLYIAWGKNTYISIFSQDSNSAWSLTNNFYFADGGAVISGNNPSTSFITGTADDTDSNNNKTVKEPLYDDNMDVYQLNKNVRFDTKNGNLIVLADGAAAIYNRDKTMVTGKPYGTTVSDVNFAPWSAVDATGQKFILYLAKEQSTVIGLIGFTDSTKSSLTVTNLKKFTKDGLDGVKDSDWKASRGTRKIGNKLTDDKHNIPSSQPDNVISEYFKWYWYWKSSASAPDENNDYILKTQIVPPVCPSCPACSSNGTCGTASACTNCGGQGGSGTLTQTGTSIFDASGNRTSCDILGPNGVGYDASKNQVSCANLNKGVAASAAAAPQTQTAGAAASATIQGGIVGAGDVVNTAVNKVGNVASNVVGAAGNFAGSVVKTTGSVLKTAAGDVSGIFKPSGDSNKQGDANDNQIVRTQEQSQSKQSGTQRNSYYGTHNQIVDQYSYNGQLTSRGSANYIPVTADFSAFAK